MKDSGFDRRKFLRNAGLGSAALASFANAGWTRAQAGGMTKTHWNFAAIELGPLISGVQYAVGMEGHGFITADGEINGEGSFVEINAASPVPNTILASGTWLATSLTSTNFIGTYGPFEAGVIDMVIELVEDLPAPGVVTGVTLNLVCNIPAAGLFNPGLDEGYFLTLPGSPPLLFQPPVVVGGTTYSILNESRNEPGD